VPGNSFHPDGTGHNTMRLNFSHPRPELIEEGIRRLGLVLKEKIAAPERAGRVAVPTK